MSDDTVQVGPGASDGMVPDAERADLRAAPGWSIDGGNRGEIQPEAGGDQSDNQGV